MKPDNACCHFPFKKSLYSDPRIMRGRSVAMMAKEGHKWQVADMAADLEIPTELIAHSQHIQTAALGLLRGLG